MIFLIFLYLFLCQAFASLSMMLVWGEPDDTSNCTTSSITNFVECYSKCFYIQNCVLAFLNENNPVCTLCAFQNVTGVRRATYLENLKTAIKFNASSCPSNVTIEEQVISGYNYTSVVLSNGYKIVYSNDTWQLQYTEIKSCPTGWKLFQRAMGPWCIMPSYGTYYNKSYSSVTWDVAQATCAKYDSVLTGVETKTELSYIVSYFNAKWAGFFFYTWLGGQRREECTWSNVDNWNATLCNNSLTSFEWTDGFTSGTNGFAWVKGQPDTINQTCLSILTYITDANFNGLMDDSGCETPYKGLTCGKQPGI